MLVVSLLIADHDNAVVPRYQRNRLQVDKELLRLLHEALIILDNPGMLKPITRSVKGKSEVEEKDHEAR
jgi:hypothetical protein